MASHKDPQSTPQQPPPETLHWGIAYLREDLQDMRQDMRHAHDQIYSRLDRNDNRIEQVNASLSERINQVEISLTTRIDSRSNWAIGIMVALISASTSAIIAAIKL